MYCRRPLIYKNWFPFDHIAQTTKHIIPPLSSSHPSKVFVGSRMFRRTLRPIKNYVRQKNVKIKPVLARYAWKTTRKHFSLVLPHPYHHLRFRLKDCRNFFMLLSGVLYCVLPSFRIKTSNFQVLHIHLHNISTHRHNSEGMMMMIRKGWYDSEGMMMIRKG